MAAGQGPGWAQLNEGLKRVFKFRATPPRVTCLRDRSWAELQGAGKRLSRRFQAEPQAEDAQHRSGDAVWFGVFQSGLDAQLRTAVHPPCGAGGRVVV